MPNMSQTTKADASNTAGGAFAYQTPDSPMTERRPSWEKYGVTGNARTVRVSSAETAGRVRTVLGTSLIP